MTTVMVDPISKEIFTVYERKDWGARPPKSTPLPCTDINGDFGHHTDTELGESVEECFRIIRGAQNWHMDYNDWNDIGYSFMYDNEGNIYICRGWFVSGGHTAGYNSSSHAFCFIGNTSRDHYSDKAKRAFNCLRRVRQALRNGPWLCRSHGDVNSTSCCGTKKINWIHLGCPQPGGPIEEDWLDMATQEQVKAMFEEVSKDKAYQAYDENLQPYGPVWWIRGETRTKIGTPEEHARLVNEGILGPIELKNGYTIELFKEIDGFVRPY